MRLVVVMACLMVGVMLGLSSYVPSVGACSPTEYGVWIPAPVITSTAVFPMPPSVREIWYRKYVIVAAESSGCGEPEALCAGGTIGVVLSATPSMGLLEIATVDRSVVVPGSANVGEYVVSVAELGVEPPFDAMLRFVDRQGHASAWQRQSFVADPK